jgi:hypothetical protein
VDEPVILVLGQSTPLDTVTPKKAALREEVFNVEILETLMEPEPEDEDDILTNVIQRRTQKVK